jgi:Mg2+/Co2+ transporter CorB
MSGEPWLTIGLTLLAVALLIMALGKTALELLGFRLIHRRRRVAKPGARAATRSQEDDTAEAKADAVPRTGLEVLTELEVSDVMVHRMAMRSLNVDDPAEAIVKEMLASPHTHAALAGLARQHCRRTSCQGLAARTQRSR